MRKQAYYKRLIDTNTIPTVVFGTKKRFHERCKGNITHQQWRDARDNRLVSRGDKTKNGNPNLRVIVTGTETFLEISTLERTGANRAVKKRIPLYLPQKLSKKTGAVNGRDYKSMLLEYLQTGGAYQVELLKRDGVYHCHITFDESMVMDYKPIHTAHAHLIGIDTNPDGFALTKIHRNGNYSEARYMSQHELQYARSNRRENLCGELVKEVVAYAVAHECAVAFEDLKFSKDKDVERKFARISHQFVYRKLLLALERECIRKGIEYVKVKPQYTSKIGLYKYCHQYGIDVHNGAALVIARRAYGFREVVPKALKERFHPQSKTGWGQWSQISNQIEEKTRNLAKVLEQKGGTGFWLQHREKILSVED
jgi:IS605 OrfB family transposase